MANAFYQKLHFALTLGKPLVLMVVTQSIGESPGRKGFMMYVTQDSMHGTIGGGIMEHKLVELCRDKLSHGYFSPLHMRQIHQADISKDRSGMICSGEQSVAFYYLDETNISIVNSILVSNYVIYTENGIVGVTQKEDSFIDHETMRWTLCQSVSENAKAYIFGGGHVSLALCDVLSKLDFELHVFDDRADLNTMEAITNAHSKNIINYAQSTDFIPDEDNIYVVLISFGYRTDEEILRSIFGRKFKYLGMMGSVQKIKTMRDKLLGEGFDMEYFDSMHTPIGLPIHSQTTYEIAISIAAQMIMVKNR